VSRGTTQQTRSTSGRSWPGGTTPSSRAAAITGSADALIAAPRIAWLLGRRIPATVDIVRQMERRHPTEPHWYLAVLGIDPAFQGRGLGPRLVAPVLDRCDAERLLCWLESANPKNHGFYRRLGFEVADVHRFSDDFSLTFFARRPR
jgi:ribosomal protein S18 acetylase RimI-like enzyme